MIMNWNDERNALTGKISTTDRQKIWAIGGGKGGVGKSLVTANISICLSLMGYRVIALDLDLGGANLHTCLGVPIPPHTLSDYLLKKVSNLQDLVTPTPIKNLSIISGAQDAVGMANLKNMQKSKILTNLKQLDADFILLDLGAGTTFNTLDFFISADQGILVSLPEPTSIENTYRFIKSVFHRKLKLSEELLEINPLIDEVMNSKVNDNIAPVELINKVSQVNPRMAEVLKREMASLIPKLIINQVRTQTDLDIGHSMKIISKKYFGLDIDYVGHLEYDATVWQSVKKRRPLLMEFPNSPLISNFDKIIHNLLNI
jgi:flagellar biosynthesis protein FlhG